MSFVGLTVVTAGDRRYLYEGHAASNCEYHQYEDFQGFALFDCDPCHVHQSGDDQEHERDSGDQFYGGAGNDCVVHGYNLGQCQRITHHQPPEHQTLENPSFFSTMSSSAIGFTCGS